MLFFLFMFLKQLYDAVSSFFPIGHIAFENLVNLTVA